MNRPIRPAQSFHRIRQIGDRTSRFAAAELKAAGLLNPEGKHNDTLGAIVFPLGDNNHFIRWPDHWSFKGPLVADIGEILRDLGTSGLGVFERQGHEIVAKTRGYFHDLVLLIIRLGLPIKYSPTMLPQGHGTSIEERI